MCSLSNKIEFVFNKIALSFIKEIKDKDPSIKAKLKEHYAIFDKSSDVHITFFMNNVTDPSEFKKPFGENLLESESVLQLTIFKDITVSDIVKVVDVSEHNVVKCYLYDMFMLSHLYNLNRATDDEVTATELFNKALQFIDNSDNIVLEDELDNVFDDELRTLLQNIYETKKDMHRSVVTINHENLEKDARPKEFDSAFEFLNNSRIGDLAKEISQDIDIGNLNLDKPEDLLNMDSIFSGDNPVLGDIIGKVSSKISNKIASGELKQEDLMQEALAMMSKLNGANPFMDEMMKNAMNQGSARGPNLKSGKRRHKK